MNEDQPGGAGRRLIWLRWNQALAQKLASGGVDLAGQAQSLAEAAQAARQRGDRQALWAALNALTKISLGLRRVEAAQEMAAEALSLAGELYGPDSGQAGTVISDLLFIEALQGREDRSLALARRLGGIVMEQAAQGLDQAFSYNLTSLATFHATRGDDEEVERLLWRVIRQGQGRQETDPDLLLFVHDNLASFYAAQGETAKAQEVRRLATEVMAQAGYDLSPAGQAHPAKAGKTTLH